MSDPMIPLRLTAELRQALDSVAARRCMSVAALVELLLRRAPEVREAARELGLTWREKEKPGKRRRKDNARA